MLNYKLINLNKKNKNLVYLVKRLSMPFLDCLLRVFLAYSSIIHKQEKKELDLVICGVFRDEAPYLEEWIEYHLLLGVDKLVLYNNFSVDNYRDILEKYLNSGQVELIDWPYDGQQMGAYENFYSKYRQKSNWVCFLDIDEFICPFDHTVNLVDWLRKKKNYSAILVYWKMFGTSGKIKRNEELVIEDLTSSWDRLYNVGKVFVNTRFPVDKIYHHKINSLVNFIGVKIKIPCINQFGKFIYFNVDRTSNKKVDIQINHYWSKTFSEYIEKKTKRKRAFNNESVYDLSYFYRHELQNTAKDYKIQKYLIALKERLNRQ